MLSGKCAASGLRRIETLQHRSRGIPGVEHYGKRSTTATCAEAIRVNDAAKDAASKGVPTVERIRVLVFKGGDRLTRGTVSGDAVIVAELRRHLARF